MHYVKKPQVIEIVEWEDVEAEYSDSLILGNGSSIAISPAFSYKSLYETACEAAHLNPAVLGVFEYLKTRDFELVLNLLWQARHVNKALRIPDGTTKASYDNVREALAQAIRQSHARYDEVVGALPSIAGFMQPFSIVVSLNYDLLIYWALLAANRELGNWFKDCFLHGNFEPDWERFLSPYDAPGATLVFYPHGNLSLATDLDGSEFKVCREDEQQPLLERILERWDEGDVVPLFVSEGSRNQKENAIRRSEYLSIVYNTVLPFLGPSAVVAGWSMGDQDHHILRQLGKSKITRLAFSVYRVDKDAEQLNEQLWSLDRKLRRFMSRGTRWVFFDSESEGFWVNTLDGRG
jgi:uncharacterized protein DUF4917